MPCSHSNRHFYNKHNVYSSHNDCKSMTEMLCSQICTLYSKDSFCDLSSFNCIQIIKKIQNQLITDCSLCIIFVHYFIFSAVHIQKAFIKKASLLRLHLMTSQGQKICRQITLDLLESKEKEWEHETLKRF